MGKYKPKFKWQDIETDLRGIEDLVNGRIAHIRANAEAFNKRTDAVARRISFHLQEAITDLRLAQTSMRDNMHILETSNSDYVEPTDGVV